MFEHELSLKITEKGAGVVNNLRNTLKGQDQRQGDSWWAASLAVRDGLGKGKHKS